MKKIELLAPASSFEGLKAVINAGADAVYLGGSRFGARAYATNFDEEKLIEAIQYAHLFNVKVHLTVNTLVKENEMEDLYNYIVPYYNAGLDAVIVQDLGVIGMLRKHFPDLEIHMSTQTTITSSECINIIRDYDIERIVLARELSLEEIEEIKRSTGVEVETFVHGALCYSYSGQCLLSSMIGDRSGNRGRCAQPCRKMYKLYKNNELIGKEQYLLSPKDMCGLSNLHNLINIGVDSLKIEGRMKKVEYAATIVSIYRKYIDVYYELGHSEYTKFYKTHRQEIEEDILKMQDIYNRGGFTAGYFDQHNGKNMMSVNLPSHHGVLVGRLIDVSSRNVTIKFSKKVNPKDVLLIRNEQYSSEKNSYEFTLKDGYEAGDTHVANYTKGIKLEKGQSVYRVKNNMLIDSIIEQYVNIDKKIGIDIKVELKKEQPCKVCVVLHDKEYRFEYGQVLGAINRPISKDNVIKQFSKLSQTPFIINSIDVDMEDGIFVPLKDLNEFRRQSIESVINEYTKDSIKVANFREYSNITNASKINCDESKVNDLYSIVEKTTVLVQNLTQINAVLEYTDIKRIYLELDAFKKDDLIKAIGLIKLNNVNVFIALPRIIRSKDIDMLMDNYKDVFSNTSISGYLVRNVEGIHLIKASNLLSSVDIIGDSNMYVTNNYAKESWLKQGLTAITVSNELSEDEIEKIEKNNMAMVIYGRPVVMTSANCVKKTIGLCNLQSEIVNIKDSYLDEYVIRTVCNYCYNIMYYSKPIDLINEVKTKDNFDMYRIEFVDEDREEVKNILNKLCGEGCYNQDVFHGHYDRKTL